MRSTLSSVTSTRFLPTMSRSTSNSLWEKDFTALMAPRSQFVPVGTPPGDDPFDLNENPGVIKRDVGVRPCQHERPRLESGAGGKTKPAPTSWHHRGHDPAPRGGRAL